MKKLCYISAMMVSITSFSQSSKWFVSVSTGQGIGGPSTSIINQFTVQGFTGTSTYNILGWSGSTKYPVKNLSPNILLRAGKKISENRSVFMVAGIADQGEVMGFKSTGYGNFLGIIGGSTGHMISFDYKMYQVSGGIMYSSSKTKAKLGVGPSIFLLNYAMNDDDNKTAVVPGILLTGRFPLGKEKKLIGFDFIMDMRLAPPVKIKSEEKQEAYSFRPGNVNMIGASAGIAFCFRK